MEIIKFITLVLSLCLGGATIACLIIGTRCDRYKDL